MIIKEYKKKNFEELKEFLAAKDLNVDALEWCKWAGWVDTDGSIQILKHEKRKKRNQVRVRLDLKDKRPVELLSSFFETNLAYREHKTITPKPYRKEYMAKMYCTYIYGEKAICLLKNIYPYLLNEKKKKEAVKIIGYTPESKNLDDWTKDEIISYLATVIEGDGTINLRPRANRKYKSFTMNIAIKSSTIQYLSDIKYLVDKNFDTCLTIRELGTYETKEGTKTKYNVYLNKSNIDIFKLLVKNNIMTLDRKKNRILEYLNQERLN